MKIDRSSVAVITGAGSGIGRALAKRLARAGAALALADVNAQGLNETAQSLASSGVKISTHLVDVADAERVAEFAQEVNIEHGKASILLNNAGVGLVGKVEELAIADIEWLMGINFWGVVYGVKHFLPLLRQQPQAYILNVSSVFGIIAPPGQSAYCASKFAVRGFTETLRHELEGSNVRVATIHPGGIKTSIAVNSKLGEKADPSAHRDVGEKFDKVARTTPEAAADRIVRGILNDAERILIGADAKGIELIQRLLPVRYWRLLGPLMERQMGGKF